jgi:hypothetical protein
MSKQDICQYVIVGLLTGCFWWQRGGHDTLAATQDTIGATPPSLSTAALSYHMHHHHQQLMWLYINCSMAACQPLLLGTLSQVLV